ncbi:hypothetical protein ACLEPN_30520 [Myxococcus sp. 1LA]
MFLVLTVKPHEWKDEDEAYEGLRDCWRSFAKAIRREWGPMQYVATVEKTRRGWPHLNVIMVAPGVGASLDDMPDYVRQWMKDHADACGFGNQVFIDRPRSREQVAGYIVKLADMSAAAAPGDVGADVEAVRRAGAQTARGGTVGEVVKLSQLPRNAPKGFRRLRASPGFLPPAPKNEEWTGELEKFAHPDDLPPEKREEIRAWDATMKGDQVPLPPSLQPQPWPEHDESHWRAKGVFLLDVGPPPDGEEWVDGDWERLERERETVLARIRAQLDAVQGELF